VETLLESIMSNNTEPYRLKVDRKVWSSTADRPDKFQNALNFGNIVYTTTNVGGSDGVNLPCVRIKILDDLCRAINATARKTDQKAPQIDSLYTSVLNFEEGPGCQSRSTHYVTFTEAALVVRLADQDNALRGRNLTFKNKLKSDIVLPMVFSELQISSEDGALVGAVFEFDTSRRGKMGLRLV
jgi:hypothetical protein